MNCGEGIRTLTCVSAADFTDDVCQVIPAKHVYPFLLTVVVMSAIFSAFVVLFATVNRRCSGISRYFSIIYISLLVALIMLLLFVLDGFSHCGPNSTMSNDLRTPSIILIVVNTLGLVWTAVNYEIPDFIEEI